MSTDPASPPRRNRSAAGACGRDGGGSERVGAGCSGRLNRSSPVPEGCHSGPAAGPPGNIPGRGGGPDVMPLPAPLGPERRPAAGWWVGSGRLASGRAGSGDSAGNPAPRAGAAASAALPPDGAHQGLVGSTADGEPGGCSPGSGDSAEPVRRPARSRRDSEGGGAIGSAAVAAGGVGMGPTAGFTGPAPRTSAPNAPPTEGATPQKSDAGVAGAAGGFRIGDAGVPPGAAVPGASGLPLSGASVSHAPLTPTRSAQDESSGSEWRAEPRRRRGGSPEGSSDWGGTLIPQGARSPCAGAVHRSRPRDAS
jgi:hypothetical protein